MTLNLIMVPCIWYRHLHHLPEVSDVDEESMHLLAIYNRSSYTVYKLTCYLLIYILNSDG